MGIQSFQIATPTPVQTTPVQGTSIAQMVNAANGIQQYQQSQQLNPLQIKQAQMAIEQAQQINPLAVEKAQAELETAKTGSQQAKQNYLVSGEDYSRKMINALPPINDYVDKTGEVNQKALSRSLDIIRKSAYAVGLPNHPSNLLGQLEDAVATKDYNKYEELRNRVAKSSGTTSEQFAAKFPSAQMLNTGQKAVPITMGNPSLAMQAPGTAVGNGIQLQLPPSTPTISPSGQPGYLGAQKNQGFTPSALPPGVETQMKAPAESYAEYVKAIPKKQYSANMVNISSEELKEALSKFKPGAGTSTMVGLSQKLQAIGAPQSLVDKIAGGDLSAAQETQKFLARSVMDNLKVAAQGDPTRVAEIDNFVKNFPQFDTDPRAINKFIEFSQKQANRDLQEINFYNKKQEKGEINPNTYFGELQNYMQNQGFVPKIGEAKATIAESKKETQVGHGKVVKTGSYNGKPVVQYEDGFVEYK